MGEAGTEDQRLLPIDEVARRFGLRASAHSVLRGAWSARARVAPSRPTLVRPG